MYLVDYFISISAVTNEILTVNASDHLWAIIAIIIFQVSFSFYDIPKATPPKKLWIPIASNKI